MNLTLVVITNFTFIHKVTGIPFIDPRYYLIGKWEGWGTSLAWFGDALGGLSEPVQNEINSALFSPENLNLNIVRYAIGATPPSRKSCGRFRTYTATESFRDAVDSPYLWSRDPRSRKVLLAAKRLGADTFEAISLSPPAWLTKCGCSNGNPEGVAFRENLDPLNVNAFADYLTQVVKYYHENYNISFATLSPFRQPSHKYAADEIVDYESCNMERLTMVQVMKSLNASLLAKNLDFCSITAADEVEKPNILATLNFFFECKC